MDFFLWNKKIESKLCKKASISRRYSMCSNTKSPLSSTRMPCLRVWTSCRTAPSISRTSCLNSTCWTHFWNSCQTCTQLTNRFWTTNQIRIWSSSATTRRFGMSTTRRPNSAQRRILLLVSFSRKLLSTNSTFGTLRRMPCIRWCLAQMGKRILLPKLQGGELSTRLVWLLTLDRLEL